MAKSVQMARAMARCKLMTWVPEATYRTANALIVGDGVWSALKSQGALVDGGLGAFGVEVFHNPRICNAHWRHDGFRLRRYASNYLRRHAQRHGGRP